MYYCFFFFQAEDGIRDGHVTGVQTCALPILMLIVYGITEGSEKGWFNLEILVTLTIGVCLLILFITYERKTNHPMLNITIFKNRRFTWSTVVGCVVMFVLSRSEERRVGKACNSQ